MNSKLKSQQLDTFNEPTQATKITDLNDDCLVMIFAHLKLQNLFNVAIACEFLRPAACLVYRRKFGVQPVRLFGCDNFRPNANPNAQNGVEPVEGLLDIDIRGLKLCLQYLRCFGPSIKAISIDFNNVMTNRCRYVNQYIVKYCAESLIEISFWHKPNVPMQPFEKPLASVQSVKVIRCEMGAQLPSFAEWFPKLRRLELLYTRVDHGFADVTFKHLDHLYVRVNSSYCLTQKTAASLLRSNRHLRSLTIMSMIHGMSIEAMLNVIKDNRSISKLVFETFYSAVHRMKSSDLQRLVSEHPSLVVLSLSHCLLSADNIVALIRQLGSLKKFYLPTPIHLDQTKLAAKLDDKGWSISPIEFRDKVLLQRKN